MKYKVLFIIYCCITKQSTLSGLKQHPLIVSCFVWVRGVHTADLPRSLL